MDDPADPHRPRSHAADALRPVRIECRYLERVPGSVLYASGLTRVLASAVLEEGVPLFLEGRAVGWATAEYDLLPSATVPRHPRERGGRISGRTQEIQRLIGRSLRAVLDTAAIPDRTLRIDCDVLEADGGTRTAAINAAWLAAALAVADALESGTLERSPLGGPVSAVSVGIVRGKAFLDLDQAEDSRADVDLNVAMTGDGSIVEIQGTAERVPFSRARLDELLELAARGIAEIREIQLATLRQQGITLEG